LQIQALEFGLAQIRRRAEEALDALEALKGILDPPMSQMELRRMRLHKQFAKERPLEPLLQVRQLFPFQRRQHFARSVQACSLSRDSDRAIHGHARKGMVQGEAQPQVTQGKTFGAAAS
jgi:hypothetical protein